MGGDYVSSKSGEIDPLIQENEVCKAEIAADQTNERHDVGESPNEIESLTVRRSGRNRRTPKSQYETKIDTWITNGRLEEYNGEAESVIPLLAVAQESKNKMRPVMDFRQLNSYISSHTAESYACILKLRNWRRWVDNLSLIDLRRAYLQIPFDKSLLPYQMVVYRNKRYVLTRLGFVLNIELRILKAVVHFVLGKDMLVVQSTDSYLDDIIVDNTKIENDKQNSSVCAYLVFVYFSFPKFRLSDCLFTDMSDKKTEASDELSSVKNEYSKITDILHNNRDVLVKPEHEELITNFQNFNRYFPVVVKHAAHQEAFVDSNLMNDFSSLILIRSQKCSDKIRSEKRDAFLRCARKLYLSNNRNISVFGQIMSNVSRPNVKFRCLLPFLPQNCYVSTDDKDPEVTIPIKRPKRLKEHYANENTQQPICVQDNAEVQTSLQKLSALSSEMYEELSHSKDGLTLEEFALDKTSFTKTVEKMFNLSILLKESLITVESSNNLEDSDCRVKVVNEVNSKPDEDGCHFAFTLSLEDWRDIN
ncbi:hypothetical protein GJ496_004989 [Pomphorhynchus laevis]|nr:hypothetical protein GJ496_004989 [Pomphorhynchus laevis]